MKLLLFLLLLLSWMKEQVCTFLSAYPILNQTPAFLNSLFISLLVFVFTADVFPSHCKVIVICMI